MDKAFWANIASLWISISNQEEKEKIGLAVESLFQKSAVVRIKEKSLVEELLDFDDEEDDDDY